MDLDTLNARVTIAIVLAEHAPPGTMEADTLWHRVSLIEEELASATSVADLEGLVARRGAVSAALRSGGWMRAHLLALRFTAEENAPADLIDDLREMILKGEARP